MESLSLTSLPAPAVPIQIFPKFPNARNCVLKKNQAQLCGACARFCFKQERGQPSSGESSPDEWFQMGRLDGGINTPYAPGLAPETQGRGTLLRTIGRQRYHRDFKVTVG